MFSRTLIYVDSCVNKEFSISPRFSPTSFYRDVNSVLLQAHLCTAVDSMRRKSCVRNCSKEREGLYNGNVEQNALCAASCHQESSHFAPVLAYDFSSRCKPSRTLYASNHVGLRNFPSLPGPRQRVLIPMQIQYSYEHTFVQQQALSFCSLFSPTIPSPVSHIALLGWRCEMTENRI